MGVDVLHFVNIEHTLLTMNTLCYSNLFCNTSLHVLCLKKEQGGQKTMLMSLSETFLHTAIVNVINGSNIGFIL